jgi:D-arabinose 1-dehydrogenase-like Zn-dependent alcohol dehydrogenase
MANMATKATMRAVQVTRANGPFELVEREIPEAGPRQVRIKVAACGMCHSDIVVRLALSIPGMALPRIPGHEIAGRIDQVGAGVTAWKVGDSVGVGWYGGNCFECDACRRGDFINCVKARVTGASHDGGYAEYVVVPSESVARLPPDIDPVATAPLLCAGITTFNALRNAGVRAGATVAVQGVGGLGHLGIQYAARMGFRTVAISSGGDKEALARQLGAHEYIDTNKVSAGEGLRKLGGADVVLATAPHSSAIAAAFQGLKPRGKVVIVAVPTEPLTLNPAEFISGRTVTGWPSGSAIDSEETVAFSRLNGVEAQIERFPLERAEEAFGKMMANKVRFRVVLTP